MAISDLLKKNVEKRDLEKIRTYLFSLMALDLGLQQGGRFDENLRYCLSHGISESELFQEDNGKELPTEISQDNMSKICALMGNNFSKRKLEAAQRMGAVLYPEKKNSTQAISSNSTEGRRYTKRREPEHSSVPTGVIVAAAAAAVVVGVIIAVALG